MSRERAQVAALTHNVQEVCGQSVQVAFVDQGYTGEEAAQAANQHGIRLEVVKHTEAKRGFVPVAPTMGRGAHLRLARTLSASGNATTSD